MPWSSIVVVAVAVCVLSSSCCCCCASSTRLHTCRYQLDASSAGVGHTAGRLMSIYVDVYIYIIMLSTHTLLYFVSLGSCSSPRRCCCTPASSRATWSFPREVLGTLVFPLMHIIYIYNISHRLDIFIDIFGKLFTMPAPPLVLFCLQQQCSSGTYLSYLPVYQ